MVTPYATPYNAEMEADVVGAILTNSGACGLAFSTLVVEDFFMPEHQETFRAALRVSHRGEGVDLASVAAQLDADGATGSRKRLVNVVAQVLPSFNFVAWVRVIADLGARRRFMVEAEAQRVRMVDLSQDLDGIVADWVTVPDAVRVPITDVEEAEEITSLESTEEQGGWVIVNTLRRRERVVWTGGEGSGKSELGRAAAISVAAGVNLWTHAKQEPLPTLLVDLENEQGDIGEAARRIAKNLGSYSGGCLAKSRTQGLDLLNARDERWLDSLVAKHEPALLVIGPLYKMYRGSESKSKYSEEAAEHVAGVLDALRVKHDCALWIEAHAPHGEGGDRAKWRPRGSALWMGWPNFGFGLKPLTQTQKELVRWRGDRHRGRKFPFAIREGGPLSWEPLWDKQDVLAG